MSDWVKENNQEGIQGSIAAAVAATAAEVTALSEYEYVPELDVHFDKMSGYVFKEGCHDFHHAASHYTYHFDENSSSWQCSYDPEWDRSVGCQASLDAFVLLSEMVDRIEIDETSVEEPAPSPQLDNDVPERPSSVDEILPCIRAIAMESDDLPYGHLSIVTVDGAAIVGGEKTDDGCTGLAITSLDSEKALCRIRFDSKAKQFQLEKVLTEGGEEEGELVDDSAVLVILNNVTLGKETVDISHQDRMVVNCGDSGYLVLSLHIHKALNTCAGCEPGLLLSTWTGFATADGESTEGNSSRTKGNLERERRRELKRIKKKYALSRIEYVENATTLKKDKDEKYTDRADIRRKTVGSDLPLTAVEAIASKNTPSNAKPVDEENRGFQMLQKMGWKKGAGVGKREDGIKQPICPVAHMDSSGLGAGTSIRVAVGDTSQAQKRFKWSKAAQRYEKLGTNTVFDTNTDDY